MLHYLPYLLVIALGLYAVVDCLGTPEREVRGLPKLGWLLVIVLFGGILVGPLAWLIAGKRRIATAYPQSAHGHPSRRRSGPGERPGGPVAERPGSEAGTDADEERAEPAPWVAPDDNPEFLRSLSELIKQKREDGTSPSEND